MVRMPSPPAPKRTRNRPLIVVAVVFALLLLGFGAGDAVRAAFEQPPPVAPYDPLVRW